MDKEINGKIYIITNKVNGKQYVGQTIQTIKKRFNKHKRDSKYRTEYAIYRAFNKYGKENFVIELIQEGIKTKEELDSKEKEEIEKRNTISPNGYNLKAGGSKSRAHEETKKRLSESAKAMHDRWDNETKEEIRRKCSEAARKQWESYSEEERRAMGMNRYLKKIKMTEHEYREYLQNKERIKTAKIMQLKADKLQKQIDAMINRYNRAQTDKRVSSSWLYPGGRPVLCHELGIVYSSVKEAAKETGERKEYITRKCQGKRKIKTIYTWSYVQ